MADHFTFIISAMARGHVGDAILTVLFVRIKYDESPSLQAPLKGERVTLPKYPCRQIWVTLSVQALDLFC